MSPQTFIFIGRSGCGKGTQGELLQKYLEEKTPDIKVFYLQTGQKFRDFISEPGYTGALSKEIYDAGGLQPSFLAVWIWADMLIKNFKDDEHLIIDGTPRKLGEAILFHDAIKFYKRKMNVVCINVSREWSKEKLMARKRQDDLEGMIDKRLDWYEEDVVPAIEHLRNSSDVNFFDINGERPISEIHEDIVERLFK